MGGIHEKPTKDTLSRILAEATRLGGIPNIVIFSDHENLATSGWKTLYKEYDKSWGDVWMEFLIEQGYRVDKFELGVNRKSGNKIAVYHWYAYKGGAGAKAPSMIREYKYEERKRYNRDSKLGRVEGAGIPATRSSRGVGRVRKLVVRRPTLRRSS